MTRMAAGSIGRDSTDLYRQLQRIDSIVLQQYPKTAHERESEAALIFENPQPATRHRWTNRLRCGTRRRHRVRSIPDMVEWCGHHPRKRACSRSATL